MFVKFFCRFLILLFISGIFPARKKLNCSQVDSLINLKNYSKDYESALVIAKSNKKNEGCTAVEYFNLGQVFLRFDDFSNTRELFNKALLVALPGEEYNAIKLEYSKLRFLQSEISFIQQILDNNQDKEKAILSYKGLLFGNQKWDNGEPYVDANQNLSYDDKNKVWNTGEVFVDTNGNGIWDEGESFTDKAEEFTDWSFSDNGYLHLLLADIYKRSQDYANAIFHLNEALKINPYVKSYKDQMGVISKMIAQQGNDFLRLNKFDQAIEKYKLSLSVDSAESVIHYNLANAYFQKNNFLEAIKSYKEVVKLDPMKYKALHKMGVSYRKSTMDKDFCLSGDAKWTEATGNRADGNYKSGYCSANKHELAVMQFEKAIMVIEELNENFMSPYNEMALSLMELNLYADARRALNIIINKSPRYYKAYEALGILCLNATDPKFKSNECALENFLEASKIKPSNHVLKFRLAQLYNIIAEEYKEEQDYKNMNFYLLEAKKYARQCRQLKKTYGGAYFELGVAELNLCNKSSGIKALQLAAKYDRRYRSEVKRIIKKIKPFMNHCE